MSNDDFDFDDGDDDLFDYDVDEAIRTVDTFVPEPKIITSATTDREGAGINKGDNRDVGGLGVDEEIKVRKRKVTVKLDEQRLLSDSGIPKLKRLARDKLKLKGKGYEYRDLARIVAFYQLWADDMFPKAKFLDTLAIIEKLGHSKTLQRQRLEWIEEETRASRPVTEHTSQPDDGARSPGTLKTTTDETNTDPFTSNNDTPADTSSHRAPRGEHEATNNSLFLPMDEDGDDGHDLEMDELEAIMNRELAPKVSSNKADEDDFEDELEAMREMESLS